MNQDDDNLLNKSAGEAGQNSGHAAADYFNRTRNLQSSPGGSLDKLQNRNPILPHPNAGNGMGSSNSTNTSASTGNDSSLGEESGLEEENGLGSSDGLSDQTEAKGDGKSKLDGLFSSNKSSRKIKLLILGGGLGFFSIIFLIIIVVTLAFSVGDLIKERVENAWNTIVDFFTVDDQEKEEKYYKKLQEVQSNINSRDGICVDINLITAALIVDRGFDDVITDDDISDQTTTTDDVGNTQVVDYNRMTKQVELLARMQIKHNKYSLDKLASPQCHNSEEVVLVNSTNQDRFDRGLLTWLRSDENIDMNSEDYNQISKNDREGAIVNFFTRAPDEELNNAYQLYYPPFKSDGTCDSMYAGGMRDAKESSSKAELSIADDMDNIIATKEDSVFYWNLVNNFIPDYYSDYLPTDEAEKNRKILEIADNIYLLYKDMGPSMECSFSSSYAYNSNYNFSCVKSDGNLNNVKVQLLKNDETDLGEELLDIEDYIAGVVYAEYFKSDNIEAMKAQAVAARTYLIKSPNNKYIDSDGTTVLQIKNSTYKQVYCNPHTGCYWDKVNGHEVYSTQVEGTELYKSALSEDNMNLLNSVIQETLGQVMYDSNGQIISSGYNSTTQNNWGSQSTDYLTMLLNTYPTMASVESECIGTSGDWSSWKQGDERWASTSIGGSTVGRVGCYITSIAILIGRSGTYTALGSDFNPGTFAQYLNEKGTFGAGGLCLTLSHIPEIVPSFSTGPTTSYSYGTSIDTIANTIAEKMNNGYQVQIWIGDPNDTGYTHFVAVSDVIGSTIYIADPGGGSCTTWNNCGKYTGRYIKELRTYKIG